MTIAEAVLDPQASVDLDLPASFNGFVFVLDGSIRAGEDVTLAAGQVGWLDRPDVDGASVLRVAAGGEGARVVLYAGQPQGAAIVSHGPFIGDSMEDIVRLYGEYRDGRFERMSNLARSARSA